MTKVSGSECTMAHNLDGVRIDKAGGSPQEREFPGGEFLAAAVRQIIR